MLAGVTAVCLGPLIPDLSVSWGISQATAASLFPAQFAASAIGAALSSYHLGRSLWLGYGLMAAGLAGLAQGGWPLAWFAMAVVGLGLGLVIPATNLWVAQQAGLRRGAALATLNFVWGIGAVSSPLLFAALRDRVPFTVGLGALAVLNAGLAVWIARTSGDAAPVPPAAPVAAAAAQPPDRWLLALLAAMIFLYVGSENAIGGWLVALADRLDPRAGALSMIIDSCFWGAVMGGRGLASLLLRRLREETLLRLGLVGGITGALFILLAPGRGMVAAGGALAGLGLAPIYPLIVALIARYAEARRSRSTGWVFALGSCGGAVVPWLTGRLGGASTVVNTEFTVPLAGLLLLGLLVMGHGALSRRRSAGPAPLSAQGRAKT